MVAKAALAKLVTLSLLLLSAGSRLRTERAPQDFFQGSRRRQGGRRSRQCRVAGAAQLRTRPQGVHATPNQRLERGRNIEIVRSNAADATTYFRTAAEKARLANTALAQVMKSRQDAANAKAPQLSAEIWQEAQRKFADAIRLLERGDLKELETSRHRGDEPVPRSRTGRDQGSST